MEEKLYSVSEAVRLIGVESHVLRYWEEELEIVIQRTKQGHRIYSAQNIETFRQVKELKEKGIQLKAIRVLLEETEQTEEQTKIKEQIKIFRRRTAECAEDAGEPENLEKNENQESEYEIVMQADKPDNLRQFETILKRIITEAVEEQNEKLEQAIAEMLKTEMENLYLYYGHEAVSEAAASSELQKKRVHRLWKWFKKEN